MAGFEVITEGIGVLSLPMVHFYALDNMTELCLVVGAEKPTEPIKQFGFVAWPC
jgi:hypothetical protein